MASKKVTAAKVIKKEEPKKLIEVFEEVQPVEETVPKRHYIHFLKIEQPSDRNFDRVVGTVYWSDIKQDIIVETLDNRYASRIENLLTSDLLLDNGMFVSRNEAPKEWVKNADKAIFGDGLYVVDFMEIVDEAE